jgi:hypothetical protein
VVLQQAKKYKMNKSVVKDIIYGGIVEMMNNRDLFYNSSVNTKYSEWTAAGIIALQEFLQAMSTQILDSQEEDLNKRAKEMVINGLKGEKV